jgi:hypothetical protein
MCSGAHSYTRRSVNYYLSKGVLECAQIDYVVDGQSVEKAWRGFRHRRFACRLRFATIPDEYATNTVGAV